MNEKEFLQKQALELENKIREFEDALVPLEGSLRLLARKLELPKIPLGYVDLGELINLEKENHFAPRFTTAKLLVKAVWYAHKKLPKNYLNNYEASNGALEVEWNNRLTWLVYDPTMTWPCIHVRAYFDSKGKSFRLASSLLEESKEYF